MNSLSDASFFDAQPMFVCEQVTLIILEANAAASQILGYSKNDLLNRRILDLGEQKTTAELEKEIRKADQVSLEKVWVFRTKDGGEVYFQLSAHLINYKGRPAKLVIAHNVSDVIHGDTDEDKLLSSQLNLNNFPLAEIEWDSNMNIIRWSDKAEELFGYTEDDAISDAGMFEKMMYTEDKEDVKEQMREAYRKGLQDFSLINRNVTRDGKVIYCEWHNSLLYNDNDKVLSVYSLVHNVTDREEALEKAQRSTQSYLDLFNSIGDAIYILDKDAIIIEANEGLENTFGYTRDEVIGKSLRLLSAPGKYNEERMSELFSMTQQDKNNKHEGWGKKKNGEIFPTEFMVNAGLYYEDEVVIVIERDISDRKESEVALKRREELLAKLFNTSPIGITLLNEHHEVEMVNEGFEKLFGYTEAELKGLELDKVIVPENGKYKAMELTESDSVKEAIEKRIHKNGSVVDVIIYAVPVVVDHKVVGIYGIYVDITDRRNAEEQIKKSLQEKEMLLAEVHHRVKNNLAVITGLLELQSFSATDESARRILKESQMRVNSISMVHEKLYQSEDFSEVDIQQYFEELSDVINRTMSHSGQKIEINLDIMPVKMAITQAIPCGLLLNEILTNSFKHAFQGRDSGNISISLCNKDDIIQFKVEDDGVGISEDQKMDINSSLGMTLIKTLAKQLDAKYQYESEIGTTFEFEFKRKRKIETR